MQYADFALWQREWLDEEALERGAGVLEAAAGGDPEQLELPTDRPRPAVQTFGAEVCQVRLSAEQVAGLKQLSQAQQATLYMTLLAAFAVLLARYSGQDDIVVGSPIANRQEAQLEGLIGFFVNTLVMRVRVEPEMSFARVAGSGAETALEAYRASGRAVRAAGGGAVAGAEPEHDAGLPGGLCAAECAAGCRSS